MDRAVIEPYAHAMMHWLVARGHELSTGYQVSVKHDLFAPSMLQRTCLSAGILGLPLHMLLQHCCCCHFTTVTIAVSCA